MKTPNEFWMCLHQLSVAYEAEGLSPEERLENILAELRRMPTIARRELLSDFALITRNLDDVYVASVSVHNQLQRQPVGQEHEVA